VKRDLRLEAAEGLRLEAGGCRQNAQMRWPAACLLVCGVVLTGVLSGCPPTSGDAPPVNFPPLTGATNNLSTVPSTAPALPKEALIGLDKLSPAVAKPTSRPASELGEQAKPLVEDAEKNLAKKQYASALDKLDRAVGFEPNNPRILKDLGMAYLGVVNYGKAMENLKAAAAANGDDLELQLLLGQIQEANNKPADAIVSYRTALLTSNAKPEDPRAAEALARLGDLLARQGHWTASLQAYDRLSDWINKYSASYVGRPMVEKLVLRPERIGVERARMMLRLGRPAEALTVLEQAREADRSNPTITRLMVEALIATKQTDKARDIILEMASNSEMAADVVPMVETVTRSQNNPALPAEIWKAALDAGKKDADLAMALARVSVKVGTPKQAVEILTSGLDVQPGNLRARKMLAELLANQKQTDRAMRELATVVATDTNQSLDVAPRIRQIVARDAAFKLDAFIAAIDDKGKDAEAMHYVAGIAAAAKRDLETAAAQQRKALAISKEFLPAWEALMDVNLALRSGAQIDKTLKESQQLPERLGFMKLFLLGKVQIAGGEMTAAADTLNQASKLAQKYDVKHVPTLSLLASALRGIGRTQDAARTLAQALEIQDDNDQLHVDLIRLLMSAGAVEMAQKRLDELLLKHPDYLGAQTAQVELWQQQGKNEKARVLLEQLKAINPKNPEVQMLDFRMEFGAKLGKLSKEDFKKATARLTEMIRQEGGNDDALVYLGALLEQSSHRGEALTLWESAYEATGKSPKVARPYAAALYRAKQFAKAEPVIREVLKSSPKDSSFRLMLMEVLQKQNKNAEAIAQAEQWLADSQEDRNLYRSKLVELYKKEKLYDKANKLLDDWTALEADRRLLGALRAQKLDLYAQAKQFKQAEDFTLGWIKDERTQVAGNVLGPQLSLLGVLEDAKQFDQALRLLDTWVGTKTDASVRLLRMRQIDMLVQAGKIDDAKAKVAAWLKKTPNELAPREILIAALQKVEKFDVAAKLLEQWLAEMTVDPTLPPPPAAFGGEGAPGLQPPNQEEEQEGPDEGTDEGGDQGSDEENFGPIGQGPADVLMQDVGANNAPRAVDAHKTPATAKSQPTSLPTTKPATRPTTRPATKPSGKVRVSQEVVDWARHMTVSLLMSQEKYDKALAKADEFIKAYPKTYQTAAAYQEMMAQRLSGHERTMQLMGNPLLLLYQLKSTCLMELNKPAEALAVLEKAMEIDPDDTGLNNDLGYQYADMGLQLDKAERMIRKALADQQNSAFLDSLAWVLYKQAKFDQADRIFDQILSDDTEEHSENCVLYDHAGDVAWRLGDKDKAQQLWTKAVELGKKEKIKSSDTKKVLKNTPAKLDAVKAKKEPSVAPLGKGVTGDAGAQPTGSASTFQRPRFGQEQPQPQVPANVPATAGGEDSGEE